MKPSLWILPSLLAAPALVPLVAAVAFDNGAARLSDRLSSQFLPEGSTAESGTSHKEFSDEWLPAGANPAGSLRSDGTAESAAAAPLIASADQANGSSEKPDQPSSTKDSDRKESRGVVRFGDTLIKIAQRYGITLSDLLRLNPGLETARLVVGSQIRLAQSSPIRSRSLLALKPSTSGGVSWPELPDFGNGNPGQQKTFERSVPATQWMWPTKGVFTSGYGWRWGRMHKGIDVANNVGTPIVAAREGQVIFSGWSSGGYGYLVEILHPDGSKSLYAHNSRLEVRKGQMVRQGQLISRMGSTGRSTGPHLHFEIRPAGKGAINPLKLLPPRA